MRQTGLTLHKPEKAYQGYTLFSPMEGSNAYIKCVLEALHEHGDHYVAVGRVISAQITSDKEPLMFYAGTYPQLQKQTDESVVS